MNKPASHLILAPRHRSTPRRNRIVLKISVRARAHARGRFTRGLGVRPCPVHESCIALQVAERDPCIGLRGHTCGSTRGGLRAFFCPSGYVRAGRSGVVSFWARRQRRVCGGLGGGRGRGAYGVLLTERRGLDFILRAA